MANVAAAPDIPAPVAEKLKVLRRRLLGWLVVDGLAQVLLVVLGLIAADFLLDRLFEMDRPQRVVMLLLVLIGLAAIVWRSLVRPLMSIPSDDALCLRVEDKHKGLGESLISAVQLSRVTDLERTGASPVLVRASIDRGVEKARPLDFSDVLDTTRFKRSTALLVGSLLALGIIAIAVGNSRAMSIWFNRNVMLGDATWPQDVYLVVRDVGPDNTLTLARGQDARKIVEVTRESKTIPEEVYVDFQPSRGRQSQLLNAVSKREFALELPNVMEEFQFRARAGRARTEWISIKLVEQPAVEELSLSATPPEYTMAKPQVLPVGRGPYYLLKGSRLKIAGVANKPLAQATLRIMEQTREIASHPLSIKAGDRFSLELSPEQTLPGAYEIHLTDTLGFNSKRPTVFTIRQRADRAPRVRASLVGVRGMVVPRAVLPYQCQASDDYRVTAARLRFQTRPDDAEAQPLSGEQPFPEIAGKLPAKEIEFSGEWALESLNIPVGSSLSFRFEADDNDNVSGPNVGQSPEFLVRVVTEEQLRADLLRREKEQRQEFERLLKQQEDLLTETRALEAAAAEAADLALPQRQKLMQIQRDQKLLGANVLAIAERLADNIAEIRNNRLEEEGGPLVARLTEKIIQPMREIGEIGSPEAQLGLDKARRLAAEQAERQQALGEAATKQDENVVAMREILLHMVKTEGYQEAVNMLYEIEKSQRGVHDLTDKEEKERIQKILEESGKE
jgi:hypothetical protein